MENGISDNELPALFQAADSASKEAQIYLLT